MCDPRFTVNVDFFLLLPLLFEYFDSLVSVSGNAVNVDTVVDAIAMGSRTSIESLEDEAFKSSIVVEP